MINGVMAIIGRPNTGKSTLFNRLVGERISIVYDEPGVTRDRIYGKASWLTKEFRIIDTGGIEVNPGFFQDKIRIQAEIAIAEADVITFVVDGKNGLSDDDYFIAKMLKKSGKKIILAVNKIDEGSKIDNTYEFYKLGIPEVIAISSTHGIGVGDLLDKVVALLPKEEYTEYQNHIKFAIIGRPNVGKSSLVNAILNTPRVIVSDISGTTRDAIDSEFVYNNQNYVVIDTAGLKRRGKIWEAVDKYSAIRALNAIERANICLLVLDAKAGLTEQDKHVLGFALESGKGIIIVVNKWDLVEHTQNAMSEFTKNLYLIMPFITYAPIIFVSSLNKARIPTIFSALSEVNENINLRVSTSSLNEILLDAQMINPTPKFNGGNLKIFYGNQVTVKPPTFVLFVNNPKFIHFSYERFLENRIREAYGFKGTPITFIYREHN